MRNRTITSKLNNRQGVSILWALMFLLVAVVLIVLVLTAAVTNASKVENRQEEEQGYAVAAALSEVIQADLDKMVYVSEYTETVYSCGICANETTVDTPVEKTVLADGVFCSEVINSWAKTRVGDKTAVLKLTDLPIEFSCSNEAVKKATERLDFTVDIEMKPNSFDIQGCFKAKARKLSTGRPVYQMNFTISASAKPVKNTETFVNAHTHGSDNYNYEVTTITNEIRWTKVIVS